MRPHVVALLALSGLLLLPTQLKGQDKDSSDKTWPSLGTTEKVMNREPLRFIIDSRKLQRAPDKSTPSWAPRCATSPFDCAAWFQAVNFFSEWKGDIRRSTLRSDVIMHHYPYVLVDGHFRSSGTYVFYIPAREIFYLWGDCAMGHGDLGQGPFVGDPRPVFKELAEDPESVATLGDGLFVPFKAHVQWLESSNEPWPTAPNFGFDVSKLEVVQNVLNPLSLDRCRASEKCVMEKKDFSYTRKNKSGGEQWVLRPGVVAHFYPGMAQQFVFYLPNHNLFYVAGFTESTGHYLAGPFAGDPRLVLKRVEGLTFDKKG